MVLDDIQNYLPDNVHIFPIQNKNLALWFVALHLENVLSSTPRNLNSVFLPETLKQFLWSYWIRDLHFPEGAFDPLPSGLSGQIRHVHI